MNPFRRAIRTLRSLFGRPSLERDMKREMREHLDRSTERLMARGLSAADARDAALREFGNVPSIEEDARDARGGRWFNDLRADTRFALRHFRRQPLTALTIIGVLSLGIGANSALFSAIQAETSRPAPGVPKNASHVRVYGLQRASRGERWRLRDFTYPELTALAARREIFTDLAAWSSSDVVLDAADSTGARGVGAEFVTPNYFAVLGVRLVAGPGLTQTNALDADKAAVLSFRMAEELYDSPAEAVGKRIFVNQIPVRVVGVAPPRFQGAVPNRVRPALWIPLGARAEIARTSRLSDHSDLAVFGRLSQSSTKVQATALARATAASALPDSSARKGVERSAEVLGLREMLPAYLDDDGRILAFAFFWIIALLILLVACTNVGSLLVASAVSRRHEIAVRLSLGASRARLIRQLLTESTLLALAGGAGGLLLYWWLSTILARAINVDPVPDFLTVAFTVAFAIGTGLLFGLSPALHATRGDVAGALRDSAAGAARRSKPQRVFVIAQIALSQPLLVLLATMMAAISADVTEIASATSERVVSARFRPPTRITAGEERRESVDSLAPRLAQRTGVVGVVHEATAFTTRNVRVPGAAIGTPGGDPVGVHLEGTEPGYFSLLGVPIVLGRAPILADSADAAYPIVIGSDLARTLWGSANPIGQRLSSTPWAAGGPDTLGMTVVGVYDAKYTTSRGAGVRVYTANGRKWRRDVLLIRTQGPALAMLPELRQIIRDEAPTLPLTELETLAQVNTQERRVARNVALLTSGGVALALLLASLGLYGVVSLAVGQRLREIGIRIAVGGRPSRVARMFFESGVKLGAIGLMFGLPLSLVALKLLLSGGALIMPKFSVWPIGLQISALMLAVAAAASWLPARQAVRVDPAKTLRTE